MSPAFPQRPPALPARQRGVILLLLFLVLLVAGVSLFLTVVNNNIATLQQEESDLAALMAARDALIAYAVLHSDHYGAIGAGPGHLPCPDSDGDGIENAPCNANLLGRLPQRIILPGGAVYPLSRSRAGIDRQPWYRVSSAFRYSPAGVVNTTTAGGLTLDGRAGIVAVVMAPGEALAGQNRPGNAAADYLEAGNDGSVNLVTNNPLDPDNFNDTVLTIEADDLLPAVTARVAETIKVALDAYHTSNGAYPPDSAEFDGALASAPSWFAANGWDLNTSYAFVNADTATIGFNGCAILYTVDHNAIAIVRSAQQC